MILFLGFLTPLHHVFKSLKDTAQTHRIGWWCIMVTWWKKVQLYHSNMVEEGSISMIDSWFDSFFYHDVILLYVYMQVYMHNSKSNRNWICTKKSLQFVALYHLFTKSNQDSIVAIPYQYTYAICKSSFNKHNHVFVLSYNFEVHVLYCMCVYNCRMQKGFTIAHTYIFVFLFYSNGP